MAAIPMMRAMPALAGGGGSIPAIITERDAIVVDVPCFDAGVTPDPRYPFPPPFQRLTPCCYTYVDLPAEGTPALLEAICGDVADGATTSGWAARATLSGSTRYSMEGVLQIAPGLTDHVVGLPTLALVDTSDAEWAAGLLTSVRTKAFGGFEFDASWPDAPPLRHDVRITLEMTFDLRCNAEGGALDSDAPATRTVKALTHMTACGMGFVASGGACIGCAPPIGDIASKGAAR